MKKLGTLLLVLVVCSITGTAVARTPSTHLPFVAVGSGTVNQVGVVGTVSGTSVGTHLGFGSFNGSATIGGFPPQCGSGTVTAIGTLDLTAANGDILSTDITQHYCQSGSSLSYVGTGTYTVTGGTGRFVNATGSGKIMSLAVYPGPQPSGLGSYRFADVGTITLNGGDS